MEHTYLEFVFSIWKNIAVSLKVRSVCPEGIKNFVSVPYVNYIYNNCFVALVLLGKRFNSWLNLMVCFKVIRNVYLSTCPVIKQSHSSC